MTTPEFESGEPANIEAALLDAVCWLEIMAELKVFWRPTYAEQRERLTRCIAAAQRFLPKIEEDVT